MDLEVKDVAKLLNVTEETIRNWVEQKKIPSYNLKGQYRFSLMEVENWMMNAKREEAEGGFSPFTEEQMQPHPAEKTGGMQQFGLYRAVHNGDVLNNVPGTEKEEIIRETMKVVAPRFGLDADVLAELLLDREELMPTAINHGIAVPHARDFLLQEPLDLVIVVFPEKPLEWGALDGQPVHTLFFLFSSADKRHLHLLAKIAHLTNQKGSQALLQSRPDKKKFLEFVRDWEPTLNLSR